MNITLPNGCKVEGEVNEILLCMRKVMGNEAPKKSTAKSQKAKGQKVKLNYLGLQAEGYADEIIKIIQAVETQNLINRTVKICYTGVHYLCLTCGSYHNGPHYHEWVWCMTCAQYVTGPHGSHTAPVYPFWYSTSGEWGWCMTCAQYVTGPHGSHTAPVYPFWYNTSGFDGPYTNTLYTATNGAGSPTSNIVLTNNMANAGSADTVGTSSSTSQAPIEFNFN